MNKTATNHILIEKNSKLKSFKILAARWQKCTDCRPVKAEDVGNMVIDGNNVALVVGAN
jgi:hypothetical protein